MLMCESSMIASHVPNLAFSGIHEPLCSLVRIDAEVPVADLKDNRKIDKLKCLGYQFLK